MHMHIKLAFAETNLDFTIQVSILIEIISKILTLELFYFTTYA